MIISLKRAYEAPEPADGTRILVDRLWPRGLSKQQAAVDLWLKDIAPSTELRQWFNHDPAKWAGFVQRYHAELDTKKAAVQQLFDVLEKGPATLVYSAKDTAHNQAVALAQYLRSQR